MAIEFDGREIETNANGYLENHEDWSEALAKHLAAENGLTLSDDAMAIIAYLREEYFNTSFLVTEYTASGKKIKMKQQPKLAR